MEFVDKSSSHPLIPLLSHVEEQFKEEVNTIEAIEYFFKKISRHNDGHQLKPNSPIFTYTPFNNSLIVITIQNEDGSEWSLSALLPVFSIYALICRKKAAIESQLPPRDISHERKDTYVIFPNQNHYSLVLRNMEPTPLLPQYSERAVLEDKLLTNFNHDYSGETKLGQVRIPKEGTLKHVIAFQLNKFILTDCVPGEFFTPGTEFFHNVHVLRILSLHNVVGQSFSVLDNQIVSCCVSKEEYSTIENLNNGRITVTTQRPSSYTKIINERTLENTLKIKNMVRMFLGCKVAYTKRLYPKSIYYLGNFYLSQYSNDRIIFNQIIVKNKT